MTNPYDVLYKLDLPEDCISHIIGFNRPKHKIVKEMKKIFVKCGKCEYPVIAGKIHLRYYTLEQACKRCETRGMIVCKECTIDKRCECRNGSDDSWYSWCSF